MTSRGWCFTAYDLSQPPNWDKDTMRYLVYQREVCPTTQREHYQGYMEFQRTVRLGQAKSLIGCGNTTHAEIRKGTPSQAREYCLKEDTRIAETQVENGNLPSGRGFRSDLKSVCEEISRGTKLDEVATMAPDLYVRNYRGLQSFAETMIAPRCEPTAVFIIWGASGAGKSRFIYDNIPNDRIYSKEHDQWWDGYCGHEIVLIDDIDWTIYEKIMPHAGWLRLMDRYPMDVRVKGGTAKFNARAIFITSMHDPSAWINLPGVKRRITTVTKLGR